MEKIEDKIKKEIEKKNINKKNYLWIISILIFTVIAIIYSYNTNEGILAKQTINTQLLELNKEQLQSRTLIKKPIKEKPIQREFSSQELLKEAIIKDIIDNNINIKTNTKKVAEDNPDEFEDENILIDNEEQIFLAEKEFQDKAIQNSPMPVEPTKALIVASKKETPPLVEKTAEPLQQTNQNNEKYNEVNQNVAVLSDTNTVKVFEPKTNFNFFKCYAFELSKSAFPQSCEESFSEFIKANANSKRFEIIGVIDLEDGKNLPVKNEANEALLAKNRIIATQNFIKKKISLPVSEHFYYIKSELPTRGFALRAYF